MKNLTIIFLLIYFIVHLGFGQNISEEKNADKTEKIKDLGSFKVNDEIIGENNFVILINEPQKLENLYVLYFQGVNLYDPPPSIKENRKLNDFESFPVIIDKQNIFQLNNFQVHRFNYNYYMGIKQDEDMYLINFPHENYIYSQSGYWGEDILRVIFELAGYKNQGSVIR